MAPDVYSLAHNVITGLGSRTVSVAESLTGGLICSALTQVPGASKVFYGGVVAYKTDLKAQLLNVDSELLSNGVVQSDVALQMALGVARGLGTNFGIATTGVAGPSSQGGHLPGTVFVAVVEVDENGEMVRANVENLHIDSPELDPLATREFIRNESVRAALELLLAYL